MVKKPRQRRKTARAARAYVAFDFDNDRDIKGLVNAQAKQRRTKFQMTNTSLKEAAKESDWAKKAERKIKGWQENAQGARREKGSRNGSGQQHTGGAGHRQTG